tara:strand:- start:6007 stop:7272 length:1266 start_codon:yes stop_codon:yes gene_type:complete
MKYKKGVKARLTIHEILYAIKYQNKSFDQLFDLKKESKAFETSDYKLIVDVVLGSMRLFLYVNKIISIYSNKKPKKNQYILLLSSITQLVFLKYKNYAVINCSVEIAKNKKINAIPAYINGILKKIDKDKIKLANISLDNKILNSINILNQLSHQKKIELIKSISKKPQIHIVFKKNISLNKLSIKINKSTNSSGIFIDERNLFEINEFKKGMFWVQDLSSMLPIFLTKNLKKRKVIDMCSAPGGKTFQLINSGANVYAVEKNKERINKLKANISRLNYNIKINNIDALDLNEKEKFNMVVLDAPCSAIGTLRRNPDILFRNKKINLQNMLNLQKQLLQKADNILLNNGILLYIVCSFLREETYMQINNFLKKNKNYTIDKFDAEKQFSSLIDSNGFINIIPQKFNNFLIDGFFAAKLIKK